MVPQEVYEKIRDPYYVQLPCSAVGCHCGKCPERERGLCGGSGCKRN